MDVGMRKSITYELLITTTLVGIMICLYMFEQYRWLFAIPGLSLTAFFPSLGSWLVFQVLFFSPIQETIFRYGLINLGKKLHLSMRVTIVGSSLLYAGSHFFLPVQSWFATFVLGLLRGYDYYKNKSIWPIVISHIVLGLTWHFMQFGRFW